MPISHIRPVCPAPASPVPWMGPVCTFPPGRPGLPVRLVCGRFPDASGNVELGALALLDAVRVDDLAPGVRTILNSKADRATTLAGYGILDAYTQTETDNAIASAISAVKDSAPEAFDTLKEIADWIGDDQSGAQALINQVSNKVDKVAGKGLSANDYTTAEKEKLGGVEAGAKDNVVEAAGASAFPQIGVAGKIYVAKDENKTYRWSGSQYVQIGGGSLVTVDPTLSEQGAAADAKATGDALALRPTKAQMDKGWWTELWVITLNGENVTEQCGQPIYSNDLWVFEPPPGYALNDGDYSGSDATSLSWPCEDVDASEVVTFVANLRRVRVSAPVPTKPSDIGAQPAGSYATAAQGEKADAALSRAEAEAGFTEWKLSGVPNGATNIRGPTFVESEPSVYSLFFTYNELDYEGWTDVSGEDVDSVVFDCTDVDDTVPHITVTATRTRLPTMADIPTKTSDLTNDSGFLTQHQQLTPVHSQTPTFTDWTIFRNGVDVTQQVQQPVYTGSGNWSIVVISSDNMGPLSAQGNETAEALSWIAYGADWETEISYTATRTRTDIVGYTLGDQTTKPLQPQGDYAPATNIPKTALASGVQASLGKADTAVQPAALNNYATTAALRYDIGTLQIITSEDVQTDNTDPNNPISYAEITLLDRTVNRIDVRVDIDELRPVFPADVTGKVLDFGLYVSVADGIAAPAFVRPNGVVFYNSEGKIPDIQPGSEDKYEYTLMYFSQVEPDTFLVKGEQLKEA